MRFIPVMPNSVCGPNDNCAPNSGHVLSVLIRCFHEAKQNQVEKVVLWGTGKPKRELLYADDLVQACVHLLENTGQLSDLPIKIGTGSNIYIHELAKLVSNIVGYQGEIDFDIDKPDGAPRKFLDSTRMLS